MASHNASRASQRREPRLQQIYPVGTWTKYHVGSTVVAIPEFDAESPLTTWRDGNDCWLKSRIPSLLPNPCVLSFEPGISTGSDFSWQDIVEYGDLLLEELLDRDTYGTFYDHPLFFICHGLGGLVFKRAMGVLYERFYDTAYQSLLSIISGVVFLGSPSPALNRPRDLKQVSTILKAITKLSKGSIERATRHITTTANISQKFSNSGFEAPVLSVYECKVSKVGKNVFSARQILVDQFLCETLTKRERIVGLQCTHEGIVINEPGKDGLIKILAAYIELALEFSLHTQPNRTAQRSTVQRNSESSITAATDLDDMDSASMQMEKISFSETSTLVSHGRRPSSDNDDLEAPTLSYKSATIEQPSTQLPCYLLASHQRNTEFVGREDVLAKMDQALLARKIEGHQDRGIPRMFALCGIGGLGKTTIAIEFAHSRKETFDAIFWVHAADTARLASDFVSIAEQLHLDSGGKGFVDQVIARNRVLQWLRNPTGRGSSGKDGKIRWLLIFDNAERPSDLGDYWPHSSASGGSILVTSRDPFTRSQIFFQSDQGLDLEPFDITGASRWLLQLACLDISPENLTLSETIVEKLSGLPLAIRQVAGAIQRRQLSLAEFMNFYSEETFRAEIYQDQSTYGTLQKPIWAVFAFNALSKTAYALMQALCFLDPDSIPEILLTRSMFGSQIRINLEGFPSTQLELMQARTELAGSSLVKRDVGSKTITIPRIVQASAIATMSKERLIQAFETMLDILDIAWPQHNFDFDYERFQKCRPLLPHVVHLLHQFEMSQTLQDCREYNNKFAKVLIMAGWYQGGRGGYAEALSLHRASLRLAEEAPEPDHLILFMSHFNQAEHGLMTADYSMALSHSRASVLLAEKYPSMQADARVWGVGYLGYLALAESLMNYKEWDAAILQCELAIASRAEDKTGGSAATAINNKAHCLWRNGRYDEAWKVLEDYAAMADQFWTPAEVFRIAMNLFEMGNVRWAQERWNESFELHSQAYHHLLNIFSRGHFRVAAAATKLGQHYQMRKDWDKAREYFSQALEDYGNHTFRAAEITRISFLLAGVLGAMGDANAAETRKGAEYELLELSLRTGRRLQEEDLAEVVAYWAY